MDTISKSQRKNIEKMVKNFVSARFLYLSLEDDNRNKFKLWKELRRLNKKVKKFRSFSAKEDLENFWIEIRKVRKLVLKITKPDDLGTLESIELDVEVILERPSYRSISHQLVKHTTLAMKALPMLRKNNATQTSGVVFQSKKLAKMKPMLMSYMNTIY